MSSFSGSVRGSSIESSPEAGTQARVMKQSTRDAPSVFQANSNEEFNFGEEWAQHPKFLPAGNNAADDIETPVANKYSSVNLDKILLNTLTDFPADAGMQLPTAPSGISPLLRLKAPPVEVSKTASTSSRSGHTLTHGDDPAINTLKNNGSFNSSDGKLPIVELKEVSPEPEAACRSPSAGRGSGKRSKKERQLKRILVASYCSFVAVWLPTLVALIYLVTKQRDMIQAVKANFVTPPNITPPLILEPTTDTQDLTASLLGKRPVPLMPISPNTTEMSSLMHRPDLYISYFGVDYEPVHAVRGNCSANVQREVYKDIILASQVARSVRLHSTDCYQADYALQCINDFNLDLGVSLGVRISSDADENVHQIFDLLHILAKYSPKLIDSIFVGDRAISRGHVAAEDIIGYIVLIREFLQATGISDIPVGTTEYVDAWSPELVAAVDIAGIAVQPYAEEVPAENAAEWIKHQVEVDFPGQIWPKVMHNVVVTMLGWPTREELGDQGQSEGGQDTGAEALKTFQRDWVCSHAVQRDRQLYYWRELVDSDSSGDNGVHGHMGIFDANRSLRPNGLVQCEA